MRLVLVRHGESTGNITQVLQGRDETLTERGRAQARAVATHIANTYDVRKLYASPLARAFETASIIGAAVGMEPEPREPLAEINVGRAAGLTVQQWVEQHPEQERGWTLEGIDFEWPGGESGRQLGQRVATELDRMIEQHRGEDGTVVAVSHGGALAWAIGYLLRESLERWPQHTFDNCSITEVQFGTTADEEPVFVYRNDVAHLSVVPNEEVATGRL